MRLTGCREPPVGTQWPSWHPQQFSSCVLQRASSLSMPNASRTQDCARWSNKAPNRSSQAFHAKINKLQRSFPQQHMSSLGMSTRKQFCSETIVEESSPNLAFNLYQVGKGSAKFSEELHDVFRPSRTRTTQLKALYRMLWKPRDCLKHPLRFTGRDPHQWSGRTGS